jgi:hypothetical protein
MMKITAGKGFQITFANGYTVSVQWGPGNYCDNHSYYWCSQAETRPTVIARFGDDGSDYLSGLIFAENGSSAPLVEARKRAISLKRKV